jgi:TonB family protein
MMGSFLLTWLLSSTAVVALALAVERLLARRVSAAARHAILLAALLAPAVLAVVPRPVRVVAPASSEWIGGLQPTGPLPQAEEGRTAADVVLTIWLTGIAVVLARTSREALRWRAIVRNAAAVTDGDVLVHAAPAGIATSDACCEPAVAGLLAPTILLPARRAWTADELRTVIVHELEHVRRYDNLWTLLVQLASAPFWFSPLHAYARRRLVELRERACDAAVLAQGCDRDAYLSALARSCQFSSESTAAAAMSRLDLRERMESIMSDEPVVEKSRVPWSVRIGIGLAIVAVAASFAALAPSRTVLASPTPAVSQEAFDAAVTIRRGLDGRYLLTMRIDAPEGPFTTVAVLQSLPDERTQTTVHGGRTYKVTVAAAANGAGTATVDVHEGDSAVWSKGLTFALDEPAPQKSAVDRPPRVISRVDPIYPAEAKLAGVSGMAIVEAYVNSQGGVDSVSVVRDPGHGLGQAAADAVKQWQFEPAIVDGKPAAFTFNITINFKL